MTATLQQQLKRRFFNYVAITSQSNAVQTVVPSTPGQRELAELLAEELRQFGLQDIYVDEHAIVYAVKPGRSKTAAKIGFVAHLDTVDVGLSEHIRPQVLRYSGHDLCLNERQDIWFRAHEHPEALPYKDQDIIFSDGTSVLGADNKAAIAVLMTLMENLQSEQLDASIYLAFVPDEEIGLRGSKLMDLERFNVDFAYTLDCCEVGELIYETFNAAAATVTIEGITAHPMSAKNVLINPVRVAHDFIGCFDRYDSPEHTAEKEGYFYITDLQANPHQAQLHVSIRDFERSSFEARKRYLEQAVETVQNRYPRATLSCYIQDVYSNIRDAIGEDQTAIELLVSAFKQRDIEPNIISMRGGTDGSALSAKGILTPNYFTGALNFHSRFEFLPLTSFAKSYHVTERLCRIAGRSKTINQVLY